MMEKQQRKLRASMVDAPRMSAGAEVVPAWQCLPGSSLKLFKHCAWGLPVSWGPHPLPDGCYPSPPFQLRLSGHLPTRQAARSSAVLALRPAQQTTWLPGLVAAQAARLPAQAQNGMRKHTWKTKKTNHICCGVLAEDQTHRRKTPGKTKASMVDALGLKRPEMNMVSEHFSAGQQNPRRGHLKNEEGRNHRAHSTEVQRRNACTSTKAPK